MSDGHRSELMHSEGTRKLSAMTAAMSHRYSIVNENGSRRRAHLSRLREDHGARKRGIGGRRGAGNDDDLGELVGKPNRIGASRDLSWSMAPNEGLGDETTRSRRGRHCIGRGTHDPSKPFTKWSARRGLNQPNGRSRIGSAPSSAS